MKDAPKASNRFKLPALIGVGVIGGVLIIGLIVWGVVPSASSPPETAGATTAVDVAEAPVVNEEGLTEAQIAWRERQAAISQVMARKDRATLIGDSPTQGATDADVILFKFSDFQCPYCAVAASNMKAFMGQHEATVLYVYKHFPLTSIHDQAMPSARAAWAAGQQGQFWLYHDGLFAHRDRLGEDLYVELAELLQLDLEQFNRDRASEAALAAIEADLALVQELGINSTPTFLMNDFLIPPGAPLEFFEDMLTRFQQFIDQQRG